jgi:hypothetical protein
MIKVGKFRYYKSCKLPEKFSLCKCLKVIVTHGNTHPKPYSERHLFLRCDFAKTTIGVPDPQS